MRHLLVVKLTSDNFRLDTLPCEALYLDLPEYVQLFLGGPPERLTKEAQERFGLNLQ